MSGATLTMEGMEAIQRGLRELPEVAERELLATMTAATLLAQREVMERTPRVTGLTARSITSDAYRTPLGVEGTVSSSQISMVAVELGTKAHMPPVEALVPWVRAVLGVAPKDAKRVAWLVARKIARRGTKAQAPMGRTMAEIEGQVVALFEAAAGRIGAQLMGGAA